MLAPSTWLLLWKSAGAPFLAAAVFLLVVFAVTRLPKLRTRMGLKSWAVVGVLSAFLGFVTGYLLLNGLTPVPPRARWQWLLVFAPVAALWAIVEVLWLRDHRREDDRSAPSHGRALGLWGMRIALLLPLIILTLTAKWADYQPEPWSLMQSALTVGVYLLLASALLYLLDHATESMQPFFLGAGLGTWVGAASFVLLFGASTNLSQMTGALGAALGAITLATFLPGSAGKGVARGLTTFCTPLLLALCLNGTYYGSSEPQWIALLAAGAAALGIGRFPRVPRLEGLWISLVRVGAMSLFLAAAVFLGFREYTAEDEESGAESPMGIDYESYYGG